MSTTSRPERGEATRDALLGAARALFAERGYAGVGTEEVVRRAGVTRGALYHHFRDKQDLFRAVFEQTEAELDAGDRRPRGRDRRPDGAARDRACARSSTRAATR